MPEGHIPIEVHARSGGVRDGHVRFSRLRRQEGFTVLEVVVSALILGLIALSTLTALDTASRFSSEEQKRSQASDLAQQDQDRLRSMTVAQLSNLNQTRTVTLGLNTFTIASTAQFVSDSTGTSSCNASASGDYIKTTSTVTWSTIGSRPPVIAESVITPAVGGTVVVKVVDGKGNPVPGMNVSGAGAGSNTTGPDGCAIFGGLLPGTFNFTASQAGYVDKDGNTSPPASQQATTVVDAATARKAFQFDRAGQIAVSFDTRVAGVVGASSADMITMFNNNMTLPSFRWAGTLSSYQLTITATQMFPFSSAYTVYAGSCPGDAPSQNGVASDPSVTVPPGGTGSLLLHLPAINLSVLSGTVTVPGSPVARPHVVLTDQNCGGSPPTQGGSPLIEHVLPTTTPGALVDPGQPFGTYTLCADNGLVHVQIANIANNDLVNGTNATLYLGSGGAGVCT
jgi:Tfp pilus assembly protein PilV